MDTSNTTTSLLRMVGIMAMAVGAAWAVQVLGFGGSSTVARLMWIVGAASISGAGAGMILSSVSLPTAGAARA